MAGSHRPEVRPIAAVAPAHQSLGPGRERRRQRHVNRPCLAVDPLPRRTPTSASARCRGCPKRSGAPDANWAEMARRCRPSREALVSIRDGSNANGSDAADALDLAFAHRAFGPPISDGSAPERDQSSSVTNGSVSITRTLRASMRGSVGRFSPSAGRRSGVVAPVMATTDAAGTPGRGL
jgi:hypothetical protein